MGTPTNGNLSGKRFTRNQILRLLGKFFLGMGLMMTTGTVVGYWMLKRWIIKQRDQIIKLQRMQNQIADRFEQTKEDISHTVNELIPVMQLVLDKNGMNLDILLQTLKNNNNNNKDTNEDNDKDKKNGDSDDGVLNNKKKLWDDLKYKSLIKLVTIIYMITNLQILITIQLNVLARRDYLERAINETIRNQNESSLIYLTLNNAYSWVKQRVWYGSNNMNSGTNTQLGRDKITYINEQGYLSISWWLINRGWEEYYKLIENVVTIELNGLDVKDRITKLEFNSILERIRENINLKIGPLTRTTTTTNTKTNTTINVGKRSNNNVAAAAAVTTTCIVLEDVMLPDESMEAYTLRQLLDDESMALLYAEDNGDDSKNNRKLISELLSETRGYLKMRGVHKVVESITESLFNIVKESLDKKIDNKSKMTKKKGRNKKSEQDGVDQFTESMSKYPVAMFALAAKECCTELLSSPDDYHIIIDTISQTGDLKTFASCVYSNYEI